MTTQMTTAEARVVDPILSNVVLGYRHAEHVGAELFPRVPVMQRGGQVIEFGRESFRFYNRLRRNPGAQAARVNITYGKQAYSLVPRALEVPVPREISQEAAAGPNIDMASQAVQTAMAILSLELEKERADVARDAANYDANHKVDVAASPWTNPANNPGVDINAARTAIRDSVGLYPNTMLMGAKAFEACKNHPDVVERFKYTGRESVTAEMLAQIFDVDRVVVGKAVGFDDDDSTIDIWGGDVILAHVPRQLGGPAQPSYGYTYVLDGHPLIEMPYWDNPTKSWIYGISDERQVLLTGMLSGFLIQNAA